MNKKTNPSDQDNDENVFQQAMRGVKKTKQYTKVTLPQPILNKKRQRQPFIIQEESPFSDFDKEPTVSSEDLLFFSRPGIQDKTLRNLRNGKYNVEAVLDLHGMTVNQAREALYHFLLRCQEENMKCISVIHGKGRSDSPPILKNKVNNWLRQAEFVIAFCSANVRDGRSGSLYVLLKIKRRA